MLTTGIEGWQEPYVVVPNRWTTLESSLAAAEATLLVNPSDEATVRSWLANLLKVYGFVARGRPENLRYELRPRDFRTIRRSSVFGAAYHRICALSGACYSSLVCGSPKAACRPFLLAMRSPAISGSGPPQARGRSSRIREFRPAMGGHFTPSRKGTDFRLVTGSDFDGGQLNFAG